MKQIDINLQSSIRLEGSKVIYFDPIEREARHGADYIFITHSHWDHFSIVSILELKKENTVFITPRDVVEELLNVGILEEYIYVVRPNEHIALKNLEIKTVCAYNLQSKHHRKEQEWVGYVVDFDGLTYYVAGDTDALKELRTIKCDVAFLPIGGTYTMDYKEAAMLANTLKPKIVIPIHYGYVVGNLDDAKAFQRLLDKDIQCQILVGRN